MCRAKGLIIFILSNKGVSLTSLLSDADATATLLIAYYCMASGSVPGHAFSTLARLEVRDHR